MLDLRKLAAIDILFLGAKLIVAEFACGVLFPAALGVFILVRSRSPWQLVLGLYFLALAANYIPLLVYAVAIARKNSAQAELGDEGNDPRRAMAKYRLQSLLLLVPLMAPLIGLARRRSKAAAARNTG